MERKNPMDIKTSLMSPPEPIPQDNFSKSPSRPSMDSKMKHTYSIPTGRFQPPLSPPVSPDSKSSTPDDSSTVSVRDPILFPQDSQRASSQPPLFAYDDTQRVVDEHVRARESSMFREASPPREQEYQLALEFKSQVAKVFNTNRSLWAARELAYLKEDNAMRMGARRYTAIAPTPRNVNGRPLPRPVSGPRSGVQKPPRQPKVRPSVRETSGEPKRVAREDKDFVALPDYCPPISSLPNKPNSLKVDWKGAPIDLRNDPHAHLLHPDEVALAANLRLDCATYLTSKRRIFMKRLDTLRINKEFRKTDAQQACKIDVNKASKLWQAFDKVHWLEDHWVRKFL
ncbi:putative SWIRM domain-containing protein [Halenospora varia]|nr:putative SWIRM domain-containing protein [Halenospora varia]